MTPNPRASRRRIRIHVLAVAGILAGLWLAWHYKHPQHLALSGTSAVVWAVARKRLARVAERETIELCEEPIMSLLDTATGYATPFLQKQLRKLTNQSTPRVQDAGDKLVTDAVALAVDLLVDEAAKKLLAKIAGKDPNVAATVQKILASL